LTGKLLAVKSMFDKRNSGRDAMPREASLFDESGGSPLRAYLLLKSQGSANIPPSWIDRARGSRKNREVGVAKALRKGKVADIIGLEDWELAYRKECFYHGLRILLELERKEKPNSNSDSVQNVAI
jgi:hypothetical protein